MKQFPIQDGPSVPWDYMAPHDRQCQKNHGGQTLKRIAARGGLSAAEAECVVTGVDIYANDDSLERLKEAWYRRAERVNRDWLNDKDCPLSCGVEGRQLVIRIGIDTLAFAAERCPKLFDYDRHRESDTYCKVANIEELALDVASKLMHEAEDGTTPLNTVIDEAIVAAMEDGSLAFEDDEPARPR